MFRWIVVLAIGFVFSQFPSYYIGYIYSLGSDIDALQRQIDGGTAQDGAGSNAALELRALNRQYDALEDAYLSGEMWSWPFALIEHGDGDRMGDTFSYWYEPRVPETEDELIYGGAGLVIGFVLTGILKGMFGGGRQRTVQAVGTKRTGAAQRLVEASRKASRQVAEEADKAYKATGEMAKEASGKRRNAVQTQFRSQGAVISRVRSPKSIMRRYEWPHYDAIVRR